MPSRLETVLRAGQQRRQSKPVGVVLWDPPPGLYATSTARNPNWVDPDPPPPEPELDRPRSTPPPEPELGGNPYRLPPGTKWVSASAAEGEHQENERMMDASLIQSIPTM